MTIARYYQPQTVTIASAGTVSGAVQADEFAAFGLMMPAAFTGTTLTFQVSGDGTTYQALYDRYNVAVSMTVAVNRHYDLPTELASWHSFKLVSGSAEGAARSLIVACKG